jgi:hypothetical protein
MARPQERRQLTSSREARGRTATVRALTRSWERVPERRDLLLDERDQGAGGAVARPLQHRLVALFAELPATGVNRAMSGCAVLARAMAVSFSAVVGDPDVTAAGKKSQDTPAGRPEQLNETG